MAVVVSLRFARSTRSSWPILPVADEEARGVLDLGLGHDREEARAREVGDGRERVGVAEHALRREDDQRLAPLAQRLAAQQVEVLRGGRGLADLDVVAGGELQVALDAGAGVLGALAFVAVREQERDAAEQSPLVFGGGDELVDDDLRAVGEVAELRFPQDERFGVVAAVAVLEAQDAGLGEDRVVDAEAAPGWGRGGCSGIQRCSFSMSMRTEWRWLKVPRCESCPLRRTGVPSSSSEPKATASAMP